MALTQPTSDTAPPLEALAGTVERVTYHNAENGFAVLKVQTRGKRDLITVVGHAASVMEGEWITASGSWVSDRTHGLQFKAQTLSTTPPTGAQGIEKYLGSGQMRGIGPAMAKRIVAAFGEATFDIIEGSPDRLKEVSGIGPWRASKITAGWADQKAVREIMIFLHAHGVGTARAVRIFKTYGHSAIEVMTDDPYRLAREVRGIGRLRSSEGWKAKSKPESVFTAVIRAVISAIFTRRFWRRVSSSAKSRSMASSAVISPRSIWRTVWSSTSSARAILSPTRLRRMRSRVSAGGTAGTVMAGHLPRPAALQHGMDRDQAAGVEDVDLV